MAKAHITTKDGSTIVIEGTGEEVATLVARFNSRGAENETVNDQPSRKRKASKRSAGAKSQGGGKARTGPASLVADLISSGTFKKPKLLATIQTELKQGGHYYRDAAIATALLRAVKGRELRRLKEGDNWAYVV